MRSFSYLRVSSKGQIDGDGFPRQREAIRKWGGEIVREFVEEGVSGTTDALSRPALTDLFNALADHPEVKTVIVEKADRLARDLIVSELLLQQFEKLGVEVIEADGGSRLTGGTTPTSKLIRQILAAVAEFEKSALVRKLHAARQRKKELTGRCDGRKPYGYHPHEKETLDTMVKLRQQGWAIGRITAALNEVGSLSRTNKPWTLGSVARILARNTTTPDEILPEEEL